MQLMQIDFSGDSLASAKDLALGILAFFLFFTQKMQ